MLWWGELIYLYCRWLFVLVVLVLHWGWLLSARMNVLFLNFDDRCWGVDFGEAVAWLKVLFWGVLEVILFYFFHALFPSGVGTREV